MLRTRLALVTLLAGALVVVASASAATPTLNGVDGPGFTITLKKGGVKVTKLSAGRYTITVADRSPLHNYHLKGPGVSKVITGVAFVGTKTVTVKLAKGRYTYVCDPHAALMTGHFVVS
jgi:plastocyanin